mmetsp:Transcript_20728/g.70217  ORF Transcript_20728/g.70217 Transcript_20728/m.70217 type:complete len:232 (-) Transcript_20728:461-1156(-)
MRPQRPREAPTCARRKRAALFQKLPPQQARRRGRRSAGPLPRTSPTVDPPTRSDSRTRRPRRRRVLKRRRGAARARRRSQVERLRRLHGSGRASLRAARFDSPILAKRAPAPRPTRPRRRAPKSAAGGRSSPRTATLRPLQRRALKRPLRRLRRNRRRRRSPRRPWRRRRLREAPRRRLQRVRTLASRCPPARAPRRRASPKRLRRRGRSLSSGRAGSPRRRGGRGSRLGR